MVWVYPLEEDDFLFPIASSWLMLGLGVHSSFSVLGFSLVWACAHLVCAVTVWVHTESDTENGENMLAFMGTGKNFLSSATPVAQTLRLAINKLDAIKFKSFGTAKYTNIWSEKEPREGGKILYNLLLTGV